MTINTVEVRDEIERMEGLAGHHRAMASKQYEERDPLGSSFQISCARLCDKHARNLRALMVAYDLVEHID